MTAIYQFESFLKFLEVFLQLSDLEINKISYLWSKFFAISLHPCPARKYNNYFSFDLDISFLVLLISKAVSILKGFSLTKK